MADQPDQLNPGTVNPADQAFGAGLPTTVNPTSQSFGLNLTKQQPGPGPLPFPPSSDPAPSPPSATLSSTYAVGTLAADQTLLLLDARGGGLVVDGTDAGFTGAYALRVRGSEQVDLSLAVGVPAPTARIHVAASTAAAGTASLKIPSGAVLAVTEPGAVEADANHIYWTDAGGTRRQLDDAPVTLTLAGAYANGSLAADQTLALLDAQGGGLVVDGTDVGFTGAYALQVKGSEQVDLSLAVGVPAPTARIHVASSTAAAGTASLKIPSGVVLAVTEPGAVEADASHLYWTDAGGTRIQLDNSGTPTLSAVLAAGNTTGASVISCADGSIGAPEISWTTDPTCGLYHTGAGATGSILASVNGVQQLALSATSLTIAPNVGINVTMAPVARLEIVEGSFTTGAANATAPGSVKIVRTGISGPDSTGGYEIQSSTTGSGEGCKLYAESNSSTCGIAYRKNSALWTSKFCISTTTGGVTIGDSNAPPATVLLNVRTGQTITTPVVGQTWDGFRVANDSLAIFSGAPLTITALNMAKIGTATVNGVSAAVTVSDFFSLRISAPVAAGSATFTRSYSLGVDGNVKLDGGQTIKGTNVNNAASPYNVLQTDFAVECRTASGAITLNLPAISTEGNGRLVVSIDSDYNAPANNITLVPSGADKINNVAANFVQNGVGSAIWLKANATTLNWEIV